MQNELKFATTDKTVFVRFVFSEFYKTGSEIDVLVWLGQALTTPIEAPRFLGTSQKRYLLVLFWLLPREVGASIGVVTN